MLDLCQLRHICDIQWDEDKLLLSLILNDWKCMKFNVYE